ncbi:MAG: hypothetical protein RIR26_2019 [Pseudomonadota bacterium]|jgi:ribonuclease HII
MTKARPRRETHSFFASEALLLELSSRQTLFDDASTQDKSKVRCFVSLDEVGRGCLAGPVVVGATLWIESESRPELEPWFSSLRDSKKLSAQQREKIFEEALAHQLIDTAALVPPAVDSNLKGGRASSKVRNEQKDDALLLRDPVRVFKWSEAEVRLRLAETPTKKRAPTFRPLQAAIGSASAEEIDTHGILVALGRAASRALVQLRTPQEKIGNIFFDGNRPMKLSPTWSHVPQILVTKGDDVLKSVSSSSVVAKVVRDRWMDTYGHQYPSYGWTENRGYGTELHRIALEKHGPTPLHRRSFLSKICPQ